MLYHLCLIRSWSHGFPLCPGVHVAAPWVCVPLSRAAWCFFRLGLDPILCVFWSCAHHRPLTVFLPTHRTASHSSPARCFASTLPPCFWASLQCVYCVLLPACRVCRGASPAPSLAVPHPPAPGRPPARCTSRHTRHEGMRAQSGLFLSIKVHSYPPGGRGCRTGCPACPCPALTDQSVTTALHSIIGC